MLSLPNTLRVFVHNWNFKSRKRAFIFNEFSMVDQASPIMLLPSFSNAIPLNPTGLEHRPPTSFIKLMLASIVKLDWERNAKWWYMQWFIFLLLSLVYARLKYWTELKLLLKLMINFVLRMFVNDNYSYFNRRFSLLIHKSNYFIYILPRI